jgi:hypothetical protein
MTKSKKDHDLIILDDNRSYDIMLTDLRRVNISGISKQKNNKMLGYLNLLVDDIYVFRGDYPLSVVISVTNSSSIMSVELDNSYPYYLDPIYLCFDLKKTASIELLAKTLSNLDDEENNDWGHKEEISYYIDCSLGYHHEFMLSSFRPMYIIYGQKLMNNIKLVDKALYFNDRLFNGFYDNNVATGEKITIINSSFSLFVYGESPDKPYIVVESSFLRIKVQHDKINITFDDANTISFTSSNNFERDVNMLKGFIQYFIEKNKDEDINDLKSELLLLDMVAI